MRRQVLYQVHFGANYAAGKPYSWTTDLETVKRSVAWQLEQLRTDYIDYGFIHCMDEVRRLAPVCGQRRSSVSGGAESPGRRPATSASPPHTPALAREVLDTGLADMMMFSINPSYDYQHGEYANGSATERMALYRRCEAEGVGISVMKAFAGGQLLDARTSPFGQALTEYQCIQYALDKPGVLTVLPGVRDRADLERVLGFLRAGEAERDYSVISSLTPRDAEGTCVYCNHCQPCPAGLDVGLINKYYDLARAGDALAAEHYRSLSLGADACISCGHCDRRCPFHVSQSARMREIASYFRQA